MTLRPSIRMAICLAASVLLHLTVLWPAMGRALAASPPGASDPPPPVPPTEPPPVEPGVERSDASTLTWVGYEEYREHLARLASIEQAAFTTAPGGSVAMAEAAGDGGTTAAGTTATALATEMPPKPVEATEPTGPIEPTEPTDPTDPTEPAEPAESAESADSIEPADAEAAAPVEPAEPTEPTGPTGPTGPASSAPAEAGTAAEQPSDATDAGDADASGPRPLVEVAREGPLPMDRPALAEVAQPAPPDAETAETAEAAAPRDPAADVAAVERTLVQLRRAVAALASMAPVGGQGGEAERTVIGEVADGRDGEDLPREGEIADRQSPATSRIEVPRSQLRPDRPIAREGLEIKPREPRFHSIERLTSSPRNPVAVISFGRDGVPRAAVLTLTTGDRRIDSALISSLYGWRAAGARLAELPPDGTLDMEFRIILSGR